MTVVYCWGDQQQGNSKRSHVYWMLSPLLQLKRKTIHKFLTTSWLESFQRMHPDATDNAVIWSKNCHEDLKGPCRLHETFANTLLLLHCLLNRTRQTKNQAAKIEANKICTKFLSFCLGSKQHTLTLQTPRNDSDSDGAAEPETVLVKLVQSQVELGPFLQHEAVKSYMRSNHSQPTCYDYYCFAVSICQQVGFLFDLFDCDQTLTDKERPLFS